MTTSPNINSIIAKILSQEASLDDVIVFSEWLNESPANKEEMDILSEYWTKPMDGKDVLYAELSFNKNIKPHLSEATSSQQALPSSNRKSRITRKLLFAIAASILALLMVGSGFFLYKDMTKENFVLLAQDNIGHYTLPDSSKVVLNKNSKLTYTNQFMSADRIVTLEGEAYFEVEKKDGKKFIVQAGNSQIEVLGTKFDVNARNVDERIVTTLVEGSVLFRNGNQQYLMQPHHQLTLYTRTGLVENVKTDTYLETEWKNNIYRYQGILMKELIRQLEERYEMKITVAESYQNIRVSGAFYQDQSLDKVLKVMQESIGFKWRIQDNQVYIY